MSRTPVTIPVEIFRSGTHTSMERATLSFAQADLEGTASRYNPEMHEAPVVVGHPKTDGPAYGWVKSLEVKGDRLVAHVGDVDPQFAELVRQKRYAKVSAAFFGPNAGNNPTPGVYALKHVGFLGAAAPAVKGLKPAHFSEASADILTFGDLSVAELEAFYQRKLALSENENFAEKMIGEGRLLPCMKAEVLAFMDNLSAAGEISFSDPVHGEVEMDALIYFRRFMTKMPKVISYGALDLSEDTNSPPRGGPNVPSGYEVSKDGAELFDRTMEVSGKKGIPFDEALAYLTEKTR